MNNSLNRSSHIALFLENLLNCLWIQDILVIDLYKLPIFKGKDLLEAIHNIFSTVIEIINDDKL